MMALSANFNSMPDDERLVVTAIAMSAGAP